MEQLMFDVYVAEAMMETDYHTFSSPEQKEANIRQVFQKHNVTQAQWDTSLAWYSDRIDVYLRMNDSVKSRLQREKRHIDDMIARQNAEQQRDNELLYSATYIPPVYTYLLPNTRGGISFQLDSAYVSSNLPDDNFSLTFSVMGIPSEQTPDFSARLTLTYADTVIYRNTKITNNETYSLPVSKYIFNDTLSRINGFIHLQDPENRFKNIRLYNIFLGNENRQEMDFTEPDESALEQEPMPMREVEQVQ